MKTKKQELIALLEDVMCNIEQYGYLTLDVIKKVNDAINSNSAGERRAIGSNEQAEEVCSVCNGTGVYYVKVRESKYEYPCWNCKQTD